MKANNPIQYRQLIFDFQTTPRYTFDNFVVCDENEIAYKASLNVSKNPFEGINPLYICGGGGTGKTHLLHALGNSIRQSFPSLNILYVSSSDILMRYNNTLSYEEIINISREYKKSDMLMIDDIHLINSADAVQEQVFHIYNELVSKGKRIAVAGRKSPDQMTGLNDYLKSRFLSGMIAAIRSNHDEIKKSILKKMALDENLIISDSTADYLLTHFNRDLKELHAIIQRINNYSISNKRKVTHELIKEYLSEGEFLR
ncbi:MAG: ATP-binding protein [Nitrospinae bacterium]|nr:ATP-binding protein [Nitrospinota bacterium]MBI3814525.1 ATP-binding protein [Nitrospinota bacterium]